MGAIVVMFPCRYVLGHSRGKRTEQDADGTCVMYVEGDIAVRMSFLVRHLDMQKPHVETKGSRIVLCVEEGTMLLGGLCGR